MDADRNARIAKWTAQGIAEGDHYQWEGEVWWGFFSRCGDDEVHPPDALFPTEERAQAFATLFGQVQDWHVGPVILRMETRDNIDIPE